jgi:exopolyphosphatase/guanosine-5'-triphosphate,3'-diphosphate pyrophosphatase
MEKIATVDIGSNAVRLIIAQVDDKKQLQIHEKIRIPLRLGSEIFSQNHQFSANFIQYAITAFNEIAETLKNFEVSRVRIVATSALRDAENKHEFCEKIFQSTGLKINIISGQEEADTIFTAIKKNIPFSKEVEYLLFDIGGGSIELSIVRNKKVVTSQSFNLGTVRLLESSRSLSKKSFKQWYEPQLEKAHLFLTHELKKSKNLVLIGTGGNFKRLLKIKNKIHNKNSISLSVEDIQEIYKLMKKANYIEKISYYELRPDRADVILPALKLILDIINPLDIKKVFTPKIGLGHGVLLEMAKAQNSYDQELFQQKLTKMFLG